jgi:fatty-acyl-CoA synthase
MSQSPSSGLQLAYRGLRLLPDMLRSGPTGRFTAGDLLERAAARRGDAPVVRHEGRVLSYAELNAQANRVAHWAMARGIGQGSVVGLLMENRPEYLATWLGLAKVGAVSALLNTNLRGPALAHSLRTAGCDHALIGTECVDAWSSLEANAPKIEVFWVRDPDAKASALPSVASSLDDEIAGSSAENPPRHLRSGLRGADPVFYIYTSGTTGLPKAARLSHSRFLGGGTYALLAGLRKTDVLYCPLPLYHTVGGVMCVNAVLRERTRRSVSSRLGRLADDPQRAPAPSAGGGPNNQQAPHAQAFATVAARTTPDQLGVGPPGRERHGMGKSASHGSHAGTIGT